MILKTPLGIQLYSTSSSTPLSTLIRVRCAKSAMRIDTSGKQAYRDDLYDRTARRQSFTDRILPIPELGVDVPFSSSDGSLSRYPGTPEARLLVAHRARAPADFCPGGGRGKT